jgi:threonine dehydrogenase-like Zn-dependent dehydrogenase
LGALCFNPRIASCGGAAAPSFALDPQALSFMRAITVRPGTANSARLDTIDAPTRTPALLSVRTLALGVCGTDREIVSGAYGAAPAGHERLVLGHESLGIVEFAPEDCSFRVGDHAVGIVRRPDPVPCPACASGEWDMCRNGRYTEHGIKERDGFAAERFNIAPDAAVKIDKALGLAGVLLEPTTVVAKAWDHIDRVARRSNAWRAQTALITGAGPVGMLAALLAKQRGLDVHVLDRATTGIKPKLVKELGGAYYASDLDGLLDRLAPDIVVECTGATPVIRALLGRLAPGGILCLLGVSGDKTAELDLGRFNRETVLGNQLVFGSVNANRLHYQMAVDALERADKAWLNGLISRRVPLSRFAEALENRPDDIKVVIDFSL